MEMYPRGPLASNQRSPYSTRTPETVTHLENVLVAPLVSSSSTGVADTVGAAVGPKVNPKNPLEATVGLPVGDTVDIVGVGVKSDGDAVGDAVGNAVGDMVGLCEGDVVGAQVGDDEGAEVGPIVVVGAIVDGGEVKLPTGAVVFPNPVGEGVSVG